MATTDFARLRGELPQIQSALRDQGLDGWLLFNLRARNPIADGMLGLDEMSRRWFVLIPAEGEPVAVTHGIEPGPWEQWPWRKEVYSAWARLDEVLRPLVSGKTLAMEYSPRGAVPVNDLVPAGIIELVRGHGAEIVSSGELVTRFYSTWSEEGLASHRRAAATLAEVAHAAFRRLGAAVATGEEMREGALRGWVIEELGRRGCGVGADCNVSNGINAANPHYHAPLDGGAVLREGDLVLLDLWSKESEDAIYADQTWMGFLGAEVPERVAELFAAIRDGRDAGVRFLNERWEAGRPVAGWEVDDVVRDVIRERGHADAFIHRTGHSMDTATHGMGPNIDNFETHETRLLVPGVGFSIEPGVYFPGDIGMRTEIDVYIGPDGPEVTTPDPQHTVTAILAR